MPGLPEACTSMGNTLDRWYPRAAVVVWSRDLAFAARRSRVAVGAVGTAHPRRGRRPGKGTCGCGVARAILENDRIAGGTAGYRAARGSGPGRGRDGGDAAGAVPGGDGRGGAGRRAGGCGRAVRRGVDARGHRRVIRIGALLRGGQVRVGVGRLPGLSGALRAAGDPGSAAAARRRLGLDARPAAVLDNHRAGRDPRAAAGDAELAAGAAPRGGRRRAAGGDRGGAARVRDNVLGCSRTRKTRGTRP